MGIRYKCNFGLLNYHSTYLLHDEGKRERPKTTAFDPFNVIITTGPMNLNNINHNINLFQYLKKYIKTKIDIFIFFINVSIIFRNRLTKFKCCFRTPAI